LKKRIPFQSDILVVLIWMSDLRSPILNSESDDGRSIRLGFRFMKSGFRFGSTRAYSFLSVFPHFDLEEWIRWWKIWTIWVSIYEIWFSIWIYKGRDWLEISLFPSSLL